ncbi:MAG: 4'-phosphopantetheinyl transferase superfamily protein [Aquabacterium sp.]|nr:MAG: 4'-phosphopantetheinyl transferase superfamily protein [Aquabacterium sp.]
MRTWRPTRTGSAGWHASRNSLRMKHATQLAAPAPYVLWLVGLDAEPTAAEVGLLAPAERARASKMRWDRDRIRFLAAHCALRLLLAEREGVPPQSLRYAAGAHGKPRLQGEGRCSFSLSYAAQQALIAIADGTEIGVDATRLIPLPDAGQLAERYCSPVERMDLDQLPEAERAAAFLRCWTRKEAVLKATGIGLGLPLQQIDAGIGEARRHLTVPTPPREQRVELASVPAGGQLVAAVARVVPG